MSNRARRCVEFYYDPGTAKPSPIGVLCKAAYGLAPFTVLVMHLQGVDTTDEHWRISE